MVAVRVDTVTPAHVPELAQVAGHIREVLKVERAQAAAEKAGHDALAQFQKAGSSEAPESFGSPMTISRINAQGLAKPVADAAFAAPPKNLPSYVAVKGPPGYVDRKSVVSGRSGAVGGELGGG